MAAAEALGALGAFAAHPEVVTTLLAASRAPEGFHNVPAGVTAAAVHALGELVRMSAVYRDDVTATLIAVLGDLREDSFVRATAAQRLGTLGDVAAGHRGIVSALLSALRDSFKTQVLGQKLV